MAEQQKFSVKLSQDFDIETRAAIGLDIIDLVIKRSKNGKDKDNVSFPGYSSSYTKSFDFKLAGKSKGNVNLTLSGEMLNALTLLENTDRELVIGIPKNDDFNNAKAEGNIKGTYGNSSPIRGKARDFMGIASEDLDKILAKYKKSSSSLDVFSSLRAAAASTEIANSFLSVGGVDNGI